MSESPMTENHKRALVAAYFLSRFDRKGVRALGYETFNDAFRQIGATLDVPASSVKNMRDSFDPYCSQVRAGWYQRPILPSRANVIGAFEGLSEDALLRIVNDVLKSGDAARPFVAVVDSTARISDADAAPAANAALALPAADLLAEETAFASRQRTGEIAERFFMEQFPTLPLFAGTRLEDTRRIGIGFDFRALTERGYRAVEVKGVGESRGFISFTDKEWQVAHLLGDRYYLALVHSVFHAPVLSLMENPAAQLKVTMRTVASVSVSWSARV